MVSRRLPGFLLVALLTLGSSAWVHAQGTSGAPGPRVGADLAEGVAAVVGDKPILRSEVEEQFGLLAPQFQVDPSDTAQANQLRRDILENLVSEQLLSLEAEAQAIKVDQTQIDQAVDEAIRGDRERLGADGFAAELLKEGITETQLRTRYMEDARKESLRRQLLQKQISSKVEVTDTQVEKYFRDNQEKIGKKPRALRVLDLFVRTTPDSVIEQTYRKRAEEVHGEIQTGLSFEEAARRYSDDAKTREQGGVLGRFGPGELGDRSFEKWAFTLPIGETSEPIRTNLGYHIIQVVSRDPQSQWTQIRHVLIQVNPSRTDESRVIANVESIRHRIVSGELDFAEAVRRYSDDAASRETGGDVGWLPIDSFLGDTHGAVDSLRVGDVSRIARVEGGFHVFKLIGEQAETNYTFDEIKDQLRDMVEREQRQKAVEEYLKELRGRYYVEVRPVPSTMTDVQAPLSPPPDPVPPRRAEVPGKGGERKEPR